ncbi:MAG: hypothetical protein B5M53_05300 [Candidatus Cloacimonas sp. 4484_209]|nr:MAG: hypothetical protein B5M53_05300 [Candidatus Cloacimonas sp. 4484_209]
MKYTAAHIKASYQEKILIEKKKAVFMYLIYRPISFYLTPIFLQFHISANKVTLIGLFISLLLPLVSIFGGDFAYLYVALLAFSFHVLDCVDGNISRITRSTSALGKYLDFFTGNVFWILLYCSIGLLIKYGDGMSKFFVEGSVVIGLLSGLFDIFGKESRSYVRLHFPDSSPEYFSDKIPLQNILSSFGHLTPFLLIIFGYFKRIDILLILIFAHSFLIFSYSEIKIFCRLYR